MREKTKGAGEGVIKFKLAHKGCKPYLKEPEVAELSKWHKTFLAQGLIGQDPKRYNSASFGNLSKRLAAEGAGFIITGTQTAHLEKLGASHYAVVTGCAPESNTVYSEGPVRPSSEAMSHYQIYAATNAGAVIHVHSPDMWAAWQRLGIPTTDESAAYGTPEMAEEIKKKLEIMRFPETGILRMGGHLDGFIAWGPTAEEAGRIILGHKQKSLRLQGRAQGAGQGRTEKQS